MSITSGLAARIDIRQRMEVSASFQLTMTAATRESRSSTCPKAELDVLIPRKSSWLSFGTAIGMSAGATRTNAYSVRDNPIKPAAPQRFLEVNASDRGP
jgi:hypothetical protein